jgi:hypothetical protein
MSRTLEVSFMPPTDEIEIVVNASFVRRMEASRDIAAPILPFEQMAATSVHGRCGLGFGLISGSTSTPIVSPSVHSNALGTKHLTRLARLVLARFVLRFVLASHVTKLRPLIGTGWLCGRVP